MGKPKSSTVILPPIHEVSKIIPAAEYWTQRNVLVGSYGVSSTTYVQCACGKKIRNTEFEKHLTQHGVEPKHFLKATLHSCEGKIYACDCGRTFKTVEDIAAHIAVAKHEQPTRLPASGMKLPFAISDAFPSVGYITDDINSALNGNENSTEK